MKIEKQRLDLLVVARGLADSAKDAQAMILAGEIRVNDLRGEKAGTLLAIDSRIEVAGRASKYASRGGLKLEGALEDFKVNVSDRACMDVGASTGGFTDCLLAHGARVVYAVDVTPNQMLWRLQQDSRVHQVKANARNLSTAEIPEPVTLVTIDLSFISVSKVLERVVAVAGPKAEYLILIKPQFELKREDVAAGGVVRDARLHQNAIDKIRTTATDVGVIIDRVLPSRLTGAEGNQEFFMHAWGEETSARSGG